MTPSSFKAIKKIKEIHKRELDDSRRLLSESLAEEGVIENQIKKYNDEIILNNKLLTEGDMMQEDIMMTSSYRKWLPLAKEQINRLTEDLDVAQKKTYEIRLIVSENMKKLKTVESIIEKENKLIREKELKQEQLDIDERAQIMKIRKEKR